MKTCTIARCAAALAVTVTLLAPALLRAEDASPPAEPAATAPADAATDIKAAPADSSAQTAPEQPAQPQDAAAPKQ